MLLLFCSQSHVFITNEEILHSTRTAGHGIQISLVGYLTLVLRDNNSYEKMKQVGGGHFVSECFQFKPRKYNNSN